MNALPRSSSDPLSEKSCLVLLTRWSEVSRMLDMTITDEQAGDLRFIAAEIAKAGTNLSEYQQLRDDAVKTYAAEGATLREMAEALGISHQRVAQIVGVQ